MSRWDDMHDVFDDDDAEHWVGDAGDVQPVGISEGLVHAWLYGSRP